MQFFLGEMTMYKLTSTASFDSAHFLKGYAGKCSNIHGHRWSITLTIAGDTLTEGGQLDGMLIDFSDVKKALRSLADSWDHALLYEDGALGERLLSALEEEHFHLIALPFRPTAENMARHFYGLLKAEGLPVYSVCVHETEHNAATYSEE